MRRVLILGATGAMATYLVPELEKRGDLVTGITLEDAKSRDRVRYVRANAKEIELLRGILAEGFDAVVDFMVYNTKEEFAEYFDLFREHGVHYVFLSTYRVYGPDYPITEETKRIFNMPLPEGFVTEIGRAHV